MKVLLTGVWIVVLLLAGNSSFAQLSITATGSAFTENFDVMSSNGTAPIPTNTTLAMVPHVFMP